MLAIGDSDLARVEILEQYHTDHLSVFRIWDESIPGWCDLWKIDRHTDKSSFWLCTINLVQLRSDLALLGLTSPTAFVKTQHRGLVGSIEEQLQEQHNYQATHYWITGWVSPYTAIDAQGRHYQSHRLSGVRVLAGDFQGVRGQMAGNRYIHAYAREIINRLANNDFREYHHHQTWKQAVSAIDWAEWLQGMTTHSKCRIDGDHHLQVRLYKGMKKPPV